MPMKSPRMRCATAVTADAREGGVATAASEIGSKTAIDVAPSEHWARGFEAYLARR